MNENFNDCHQRETTCTFLYMQNAKKIETVIYIQKARHFAKSKTISVTFLYAKSMTLYFRGETASGRRREAHTRQIARAGKLQAQDARAI